MKSVVLLLLALQASPAASAQTTGAWSASSAGGSVTTGKQLLRGRPLFSPESLSPSAQAVRISWRITLLSPPPPGLVIKLCRIDKCIPLPALSGERRIDVPLAANGEFRFIYSVNSLGQLRPALNVVRNQLTVNYR
ncbi:flagellar protein FlhE [Kosakonia sp. SOY2]|uniref:flagellar protein FlhE n=1 Tax=Kosakonia sp. SOY2 TaxID=3014557 RepID=UPI0022AC744A|nr:flagellar protein FlhE [Kosakonia sp. SOY2]MCZ3383819.1 flagellar protein FlhE [Kosakonia sp. SOY2]